MKRIGITCLALFVMLTLAAATQNAQTPEAIFAPKIIPAEDLRREHQARYNDRGRPFPRREERTRLRIRRAVFVTMPALLSEIIIEAALERVRLEVVGEFAARDRLAEQLPVLAPDLVLIGLGAGETDAIGSVVLALVPAAKVLLLSQDGRRASIFATAAPRAVLEGFSLKNLLAALAGS